MMSGSILYPPHDHWNDAAVLFNEKKLAACHVVMERPEQSPLHRRGIDKAKNSGTRLKFLQDW
jgi:hypothetical protein